jgi:small subunit ribosomal protein S16
LLVIRLARTGRTKYPTYRVVAAESARAATGKFVEVLGHYNPHTKELVLKHDEIGKHLANGAQPSNTMVKLLTRDKVELPDWVKLKTKAAKVVAAEPEVEGKAKDAAAEPEAAVEVAPALEHADERVATSNEEAAVEVEDNATPIDHTDTAADEAKTETKAEDDAS